MNIEKDCLGCSLAHRQLPVYVVYENEHVSCLLDRDPFNEGHTMILPKKHAHDVDELNEEVAFAIMNASILLSKAIKHVYQPDGITVCQNGGIFNELTHYHMHVVPRYHHQSFADFYGEPACDPKLPIAYYEKVQRKLIQAITIVKELEAHNEARTL
jgi:histidine triad (HIT) family protein